MGNCGSTLDCKQCYDTDNSTNCMHVLEADADIVGAGILAAFIASAAITCLVIIVGYLTWSIPEDCDQNEIDDVIINKYQKSFLHWRIVRPLLTLFWAVFSWPLSLFKKGRAERDALQRRQRADALSRLVLALSDQQLVTGLAILIGAIANRCRISGYEYSIATSLACFSSTTHLTTLDVLTPYMIHHHGLRHWRVFGIGVTITLLSFSIITVGIARGRYDSDTLFVNPYQCVFTTSSTVDRLDILFIVLTLWMIVGPYWGRINQIYSESSYRESIRKAIVAGNPPRPYLYYRDHMSVQPTNQEACISRYANLIFTRGSSLFVGREIKRKLKGMSVDPAVIEEYYLIMVLKREEFERNKSRPISSTQSKPNPRAARMLRWEMSLRRLNYSYFSKFPMMIFLFTYSLTQTVLLRWDSDYTLGEGTRRMDFGQVTALFLLGLPVLTAFEVLSDARDQKVESGIEASELPDWTTPGETIVHKTEVTTARALRPPSNASAQVSTSSLITHRPEPEARAENPHAIDEDRKNTASIATAWFCFKALDSLFSGITYYIPNTYLQLAVTIWTVITLASSTAAYVSKFRSDREYFMTSVKQQIQQQHQTITSPSPSPSHSHSRRTSNITATFQPASESEHEEGTSITNYQPPRRIDTEADIGLVRRMTFPRRSLGDDSNNDDDTQRS